MSVDITNILKLLIEISNVNLSKDTVLELKECELISNKLFKYLKNLINHNNNYDSDNEELECDSDIDINESDDDFDEINDEIKSPTDIEVSFEDMKKIVEYHRKNPKHKFKTIQNRFRVLKPPQQLTRFKKYFVITNDTIVHKNGKTFIPMNTETIFWSKAPPGYSNNSCNCVDCPIKCS